MNLPFPTEEVELKIEYKEYLTPEQVSVFYSGLNEILSQYGAQGCDLKIEKGSLKTVVKFTKRAFTTISLGFLGQLGVNLYTLTAETIKKAYSEPRTNIEKQVTYDLTKSFDCERFSSFLIDNEPIYTKENIKNRCEEFKKLLDESNAKEMKKNESEEVEKLQMTINRKITIETKEENRKGTKVKSEISFLAKFDDKRYEKEGYEIKIIAEEGTFSDIKDVGKHEYYFIANGILHKQNGKYVKFEIIGELEKEPTRKDGNQGQIDFPKKF